MYFNVETIVRGYHTYHSVWVTVSEELSCQKERANSKDPFTVAVTTGELIVSRENFPQFVRCFCYKWINFLLSYWIRGSTAMCLASSTRRQQEIFGVRNFRELVFDRENFCLMKIIRYTVPGSFSPHLPRAWVQGYVQLYLGRYQFAR